MNAPSSPESDPRLSALLHAWKVPSDPPPRLADAVWTRISRLPAAPASGVGSNMVSWMGAVMRLVRHPRFAWMYVLCILALGAGAGLIRGNAQAERLAEGLQGRYVLSIDPFSSPRP